MNFHREPPRACRREVRYRRESPRAGVDEVVLQAAAIADVAVELVGAFFAAHDERLDVKPSFLNFTALIIICLFFCD